LKEKHEMLNAAAETGKKEKEKLLEERRQADLKELRLRQKEFLLQSEGAGSLKKLLGESRKTLENLVREVKEGELTREKTLKVKEFLSGLEVSVLAEETELEKERLALVEEKRSIEESGGSEKSIKLVPGMDVFAGQSRRRGRIIRLDKKKQKSDETYWIVEIGSVKLSFQEKEIYPAVPGKDSVSLQKSASWDADLMPSAPLCFELNLLGMRLSDALDSLGRQIDSAVIGGLREFSVVHGKGDGILSQGVHGFLKNDPRVADYYFSRPESGGFGRTEVILK
ncbi:MAG: Smr/MutS family protein, partial [Treponema sp.]|nr:Smr/MutS family protein [Treponema sp.]